MRKSPLPTILLVVMLVSSLASLWYCWRYITSIRELKQLQSQAAFVQNNQAVINTLVGELLEYSKKNPAIDPILESIGAKAPKAGTPAPATKSATK